MAHLKFVWAIWLAGVSAAPSPASAPPAAPALAIPVSCCEGPSGRSPYTIAPRLQLVTMLSFFGAVGLVEGVVKPALLGVGRCDLDPGGPFCDPRRLWAPDRSAVPNDSAAWRRVSDWSNLVAMGGAAVASMADSLTSGSATPAADAVVDALVVADSVGLATLLMRVLKIAIRRPRPNMYRPGEHGTESQLSFPSGHATSAAAATAAYATTFALRHPCGWPKYAVAALGSTLTALTAYGRVAGGMHFYTDVLAGAVLGGATGLLLPMAWRRRLSLHVSNRAEAMATGGDAAAVGAGFLASGAGHAATLTLRF